MFIFLTKCIWFILPGGLANIAAALSKHFNILKIPVDFGKSFGGKRIFGDNKTWRGVLFGLIIGLLTFWLQQYLYQFTLFQKISFINYQDYNWTLGLTLALGAILGDLIKSFFKRRINIPPGQSWIPFDQIDYTIGSLTLASLIYFPGWLVIITTIAFGFFLHILCNLIGYFFKLQKNKL